MATNYYADDEEDDDTTTDVVGQLRKVNRSLEKRAKELEACLIQLTWIKEVIPVQTNIVVAVLNRAEDRDLYINKLKERDILVMAFGEGMIRLVTHLNNSDGDIEKTCSILKSF